MTTIYTNKCPFCGTYISIENAIICPGCSSSIYYNYYYYPSQEMLDEAIKNRIAEEKYWTSEEGRKRTEENIQNASKKYDDNQRVLYWNTAKGGIGVLLTFSIPFVWFFGGHEWENFGAFGWPALFFGVLFILWGSK